MLRQIIPVFTSRGVKWLPNQSEHELLRGFRWVTVAFDSGSMIDISCLQFLESNRHFLWQLGQEKKKYLEDYGDFLPHNIDDSCTLFQAFS